MNAIRLYVVDDHPVVLAGLCAALARHDGIDVVGSALTAEDALTDLRLAPADIVLLDACLPGMSGPDLCAVLRDESRDTRCVILTSSVDTYLLSAAVEAEARGFLVKDATVSEIVAAIRRVHLGEVVLDPRATGLVVQQLRSPHRTRVALTPRESELVDFLAAGLSNPAIASRLRISPSTAKSYVSRLLVKLDVASRTAAVARAAELGLLTAPTRGSRR
jgi:DNA-binding NarL/FixJ family response regulator